MTGRPIPSVTPHEVAAASREESEREMAYLRALGRPRVAQSELPQLKAPVLAADFAQRVAELDQEIFARGVAVDKEQLVSLGQQRFQRLLELDRKFPRDALGAGIDLTSFGSVQRNLHAFEASSVPPRKMSEQATGAGRERDQVRRITGWSDLWKFTSERREVIDVIYNFRSQFESLCFGQSLLEHLSKDGRLRSHFFCGGKGRRVEYFRDWLSVLQGEHSQVILRHSLWSLMAWLANEKAPAPSYIELARDWFGLRAPSLAQIKLADAVLNGFLLGHREWDLWQFVGRHTRMAQDQSRLESWRKQLATRYRAVTVFHEQLRSCFNREVAMGDVRYAHLQFDATACRRFIDSNVQRLVDCASALLALGVEEVSKGAVLGRFEGQVVYDAIHDLEGKRAQVSRQLAMAFPHSAFQLEFEEVPR